MPHFLSLADLSRQEILDLLNLATRLKTEWKASLRENRPARHWLAGKTLGAIFEKPSLRTRVSFEAGMQQLGGHTVVLQAAEAGRMGERESIRDTAQALSRWVQIIQARVFSHDNLLAFAANAAVPVINGLSDFEHPTQLLADYLTIREHREGFTDGLRLAWVGDSNNVTHSLMLMACHFGHELRLAIPSAHQPGARIWALCDKVNPQARSLIHVTADPREAARDADVLYTDVWVSMGQEEEYEARMRDFAGYQINAELLGLAAPGAIVLHDMPAKRGLEITDEVMDGPQSRVYDQAENRLHTIKATLCWCLGLGVLPSAG